MTFMCLPHLRVYSRYLASAKEVPFVCPYHAEILAFSVFIRSLSLALVSLKTVYRLLKLHLVRAVSADTLPFFIKGRDSASTCQKCMPRSLRDFWPSSVRCIDQKRFPFQVFHLNHCFYLCLEHPVHKPMLGILQLITL